MTFSKSKRIKISAIILFFILLFFIANYYKISSEFKTYVESAEIENKVLENQLTEILQKYDSVSYKYKTDSVKYNHKIKQLDSVNLLKTNLLANSFLQIENTPKRNNKYSISDDSFVNTKTNNKTAQLNAVNVNAKGVKIYSTSYNSGEIKIQQLRVCFTLEGNNLINSGNKTLYVQVVNPKNQIISTADTFIESDTNVKLQYSASVDANYQKQDTDVCTYVNLEQKKTIKGKYKINIYHDFVKIGTTIFEY